MRAYGYLRHISNELLVRPVSLEVPVKNVWRNLADGAFVRAVTFLAYLAFQAKLDHQSLNCLVIDAQSFVSQLKGHTPIAISAFALLENITYASLYRSILVCPSNSL